MPGRAAAHFARQENIVSTERRDGAVTLTDRIHNGFFFLDGAMGTMIQQSGVVFDGPPELLNLTHPELISGIHRAYAEAGSNMVLSCTFGANRLKLSRTGHSPQKIIAAAVKNAKDSGAEYVGLDIGPLGELLEPTGSLSFESAYELFAEMVEAVSYTHLDVYKRQLLRWRDCRR